MLFYMNVKKRFLFNVYCIVGGGGGSLSVRKTLSFMYHLCQAKFKTHLRPTMAFSKTDQPNFMKTTVLAYGDLTQKYFY